MTLVTQRTAVRPLSPTTGRIGSPSTLDSPLDTALFQNYDCAKARLLIVSKCFGYNDLPRLSPASFN